MMRFQNSSELSLDCSRINFTEGGKAKNQEASALQNLCVCIPLKLVLLILRWLWVCRNQ